MKKKVHQETNYDYLSEESLKLKNQLCFPLYSASRQVINFYTPLFKPLGITYTQYLVFMVLWEKKEISVGELGKELYLDSGTLTPLLKKMEGEGYIDRYRNKNDERVTMVKILDKGMEMKEKVRSIPFEVGTDVSSKLSEDEIKTLYTLLYKILK
ncbi:MAG: MarR family transcriptional regulator [Bacilli bacterium]|nr:MarR family transcriptional regulator [Bacilli bacterium]